MDRDALLIGRDLICDTVLDRLFDYNDVWSEVHLYILYLSPVLN